MKLTSALSCLFLLIATALPAHASPKDKKTHRLTSKPSKTCVLQSWEGIGFPNGEFGPIKVCVSDISGSCDRKGKYLKLENDSARDVFWNSIAVNRWDYVTLSAGAVMIVSIPDGQQYRARTDLTVSDCQVRQKK
jgi:hypothetical protein